MPVERLKETPSQTAGPYVHIGTNPNFAEITGVWDDDLGLVLVSPETKGERIIVEGRILDGAGLPVRDAVVEIWQADASGRHRSKGEHRDGADDAFLGWGRQPVDVETGIWRFETIKPGRAPFPDGRLQAPHITLWIVARGINIGLHTRIYFGDEAEANAQDPLLQRVDGAARRETLIAPPAGQAGGIKTYGFDVRLQGERETVFLDI